MNTRKGQRPNNRISPVVAQLEATHLGESSQPQIAEPKERKIPEEDDDSEEDSDNRSESLCDIENSMEGSTPAQPAEPGTLKVTLLETPPLGIMTERESAHTPGQVTPTFEGGVAITEAKVEETKATSPATSPFKRAVAQRGSIRVTPTSGLPINNPINSSWVPTSDWVSGWRAKLPLQTIMRLLQVLVPQVEKICIDKGLTDESEILKFLQHGTLVGLLPVPHPILIRKYQANSGTTAWFRTYMWGVIYLR